MTQDELILFKELMKEAVKSAVKEAIKEELENSFKKDLKEVKLLLAKSIKESRELSAAGPQYQQNVLPGDLRTKLREAVGGDFIKQAPSIIPRMSEDTAMNMSTNGTLPDIDAPIPFIKKDSIAWREMKERIS